MKRGPKPKYAEWMCDFICEIAAIPGQYQSAMLWEIGKKLGTKRPISSSTFSEWRKQYPELEAAWQDSQIISQAIDEKIAHEVATGERKGNATTMALLFNAKYRQEYKPVESGNTTINTTLNIENLSSEEIKYRIARSAEMLAKSGIIIDQSHLLENEQ